MTCVQVVVRLKKDPECSMKVWSIQWQSAVSESLKATFPRFVHIASQPSARDTGFADLQNTCQEGGHGTLHYPCTQAFHSRFCLAALDE